MKTAFVIGTLLLAFLVGVAAEPAAAAPICDDPPLDCDVDAKQASLGWDCTSGVYVCIVDFGVLNQDERCVLYHSGYVSGHVSCSGWFRTTVPYDVPIA